MDKQGNHKQSLPESLADPELEAILEAERLALEQLLEAADPELREALEAERLRLEKILKAEQWPAALFVDWPEFIGWPIEFC